MDCIKAQSMIEPFLRRELNASDKERFIAHVRECSECFDELEIYHLVYSIVDKLDDEEELDTDFKKALEKNLNRSQSSAKRVHIIKTMVLFFAALLLAALAFVFLT